jgi:hypothetical protein
MGGARSCRLLTHLSDRLPLAGIGNAPSTQDSDPAWKRFQKRFPCDHRLLVHQYSNADSSLMTLPRASLSPKGLHRRTPTDGDSGSSLGGVRTVKPVGTSGDSAHLVSQLSSDDSGQARDKPDTRCPILGKS